MWRASRQRHQCRAEHFSRRACGDRLWRGRKTRAQAILASRQASTKQESQLVMVGIPRIYPWGGYQIFLIMETSGPSIFGWTKSVATKATFKNPRLWKNTARLRSSIPIGMNKNHREPFCPNVLDSGKHSMMNLPRNVQFNGHEGHFGCKNHPFFSRGNPFIPGMNCGTRRW